MADPLEQVQRALTAYLIERELGSGGMATVYLALDRKHDRKVAIKILHADLAAAVGADRFLQEIRVTANLQHPHILGLIDSGILGEAIDDVRGRPYYVMPYVEGESLRERLAREQQLSVADSVRIATQVASALDYAHRHGVIHRDIKPANILLHDGSAIVADFGIALAVSQAGGPRLTQTGLLVGTPTYMSPEQATGERSITGRSDIYSLGAVLYEMLTGAPPFSGSTVQAIFARIITEEPPSIGTVRRSVPEHVTAAVSRALEKIPADRFESGREFAGALADPSSAPIRSGYSSGLPKFNVERKLVLYGAAAIVAISVATALLGWLRPTPPMRVLTYELVFDSADAIVAGGSYSSRIALSPDGSKLAYIGTHGGRARLLIRDRDKLHSFGVAQTEGMTSPFFSPDGHRVAVLSEGLVRVVSLDGGPPISVSDSLIGVAGGTWSPDGFIYTDGDSYNPLLRIEPKNGAVAKSFTVLDTTAREVDHFWPDALPNGRGLVFTVAAFGKNQTASQISYSIAVADIPSGEHRTLINDAIYARYTPPGYLLYVTTGRALMAVAFDQNSMKVVGEPTAVADGLRLGTLGSADLCLTGRTLIYGTGTGQGKSEFVWVTRDGQVQSVDSTWQGLFWNPVLSPDGTLVATEAVATDSINIWIKRLDDGPLLRLTFEGSQNVAPAWTPDSRSITYTSNAGGTRNIWTKRADGSSAPVLQVRGAAGAGGTQWSADGRWLVFATSRASGSDILGLRREADSAPRLMVHTKFSEAPAEVSPDGRWLAYSSDESGRTEIYVVPFPNTGAAKWAVSSRGGREPAWSHSGAELFYRDIDGNMVAVRVKTNPTFSQQQPMKLFSTTRFQFGVTQPQYAISRDDRRFLMIRPYAGTGSERLIVVENWFEELKKREQK